MSINIYLNLEGLKKLEGIWSMGENPIKLNGMTIWDASSNPNVHLADLESRIPVIIEDIVESFVLHRSIKGYPRVSLVVTKKKIKLQ